MLKKEDKKDRHQKLGGEHWRVEKVQLVQDDLKPQ